MQVILVIGRVQGRGGGEDGRLGEGLLDRRRGWGLIGNWGLGRGNWGTGKELVFACDCWLRIGFRRHYCVGVHWAMQGKNTRLPEPYLEACNRVSDADSNDDRGNYFNGHFITIGRCTRMITRVVTSYWHRPYLIVRTIVLIYSI